MERIENEPIVISNPDGVRRAIGVFHDEPLLDALMETIRQIREQEASDQEDDLGHDGV